MKNAVAPNMPFEVGEQIAPIQLVGWNYVGLSGVPDQPNSSRRYVKGMWVLELHALSNRKKPARVLAIGTDIEDKRWWAEKSNSSLDPAR